MTKPKGPMFYCSIHETMHSEESDQGKKCRRRLEKVTDYKNDKQTIQLLITKLSQHLSFDEIPLCITELGNINELLHDLTIEKNGRG